MQPKKLFFSLSALVFAISMFIVIDNKQNNTIVKNPHNTELDFVELKNDKNDLKEQYLQTNLQLSQIDPLSEETWKSAKVKKGDSLSKIFKRLKIPQEELVKLTRSNKDIGAIKPGQVLRVGYRDGNVRFISLKIDEFNTLVFKRTNKDYSFYKEQVEPIVKLETKSAIINTSLFVDAKKVGLETKMIMQLTEIFAWDIDYSQDLRPGDSFTIIYERLYIGKDFISTGRILAAEFTNKSKTYRAALFPLHKKKFGILFRKRLCYEKSFP